MAAVQPRAHDREDFETAWPRIAGLVADAARAGARLIVAPEGCAPAYVLEGPDDGCATRRALDDLSSIACANGCTIVVGAARLHGGRLYNAAFVVDRDGEIAGTADKIFLWHFDRRWFAPGERLAPIPTSLGPLGVLVCADGRLPTLAATLVRDGARLLVMPTAWVTSGRDEASLENIQADLLARVRARENGVPFIAANKCGSERGYVRYCGKSQIIAADGTVLAIAPERDETTVVADVAVPQHGRRFARARRPLSPSHSAPTTPATIALAMDSGTDSTRIARLLDADALLTPREPQQLAADDLLALIRLDDDGMLDPFVPAQARCDGAELAAWETHGDDLDWIVRVARARAAELRIYVAAFVPARGRAFAVGPDGAVLCGTGDELRLALFRFDPAAVHATQVAPGTDILEGLRRVASLRNPVA